ncbi:unnamed protein product [Brugia pahangi]|uniref:ELM2 domain-containing protein n=1 Tax=Brugia pahangi TaxID=6280 RepID=A0A0N4SXZ0_BRUPA|nr:unnamed protein product [Brugia pahangi]
MSYRVEVFNICVFFQSVCVEHSLQRPKERNEFVGEGGRLQPATSSPAFTHSGGGLLCGFRGSISDKSLKTLCFTGRLCQYNTEIKIADQTAENVGWFDEPFSKDISAAMLALADKKLLVFAE